MMNLSITESNTRLRDREKVDPKEHNIRSSHFWGAEGAPILFQKLGFSMA